MRPLCKKVKLPIWMGSLNKVHSEKQIDIWYNKHVCESLIIQPKLDGVSCLILVFITDDGCIAFEAYTRGNGIEGTNISHLLPYVLKNYVSKNTFGLVPRAAIRCELVIEVEVFNKKYKDLFTNPRNFVSGVVNRHVRNTIVSDTIDLSIVSYELIEFTTIQQCVSKQMQLLLTYEEFGIEPILYKIITHRCDKDYLTQSLFEFKSISKYTLDGLVVLSDIFYERVTSGNPNHAVAFKIITNVKETTVLGIEWTVGKSGIYIPKVHVETTELDGSIISCVSGHNAKYILDKGIGKDAVVTITKAGDVIPQIVEVKKRGVIFFPPEYKWKGISHIEQVTESKEYFMQQILHFVKTVNIPNVKKGTILKLYNNGCTSLDMFLSLTKEDLEFFGPKLSKILYGNIQKAFTCPIATFLAGYNCFGNFIGEKKISFLLQTFPSFFEQAPSEKELLTMKGFGLKTVAQILKNFEFTKTILDKFRSVHTQNPIHKIFNVCVSGTRDKFFLEKLNNLNINVSQNVTKNVEILIVKDLEIITKKVSLATKLNIPIMTIHDFSEKYFHTPLS